jgi:hypothetical protein
MKKLAILSLLFNSSLSYAQSDKVQVVLYEAMVVVGYVDNGAYLNFTGPGIKVNKGSSMFMFGMLPSLRFKEDKQTPKSSFTTPNLGFGVTYIYKGLAFQIPFYYNAKTSTENGRWHIGIGIGVRVNNSKPK